MLNATWLESFTTLCEVGHFTRAAQRLGMTQPGISQHLRKLEAQVGAPLISQDGKSFTVTPAGEAVLAVGKARRAQEQDLLEAVKVDDANTGEVSVGCSGSVAMWVYPQLLDRMEQAPNLTVRVTAAPQGSIVAGVLNGDLDLGVVIGQVDHPRLQATPLAQEELCLVLPSEFAGTDVTLKSLNDLGFVAHPDGFTYADDLLSINFPDEYRGADRLTVRTSINQIGQIPIPVARGLGYTILPRSGVEAFSDQHNLAIVELPQRRYNPLWLISRQGRSEFARVRAVAMLLEAAIKALAGSG